MFESPDLGPPAHLDAEDTKLVTLARGARARAGAVDREGPHRQRLCHGVEQAGPDYFVRHYIEPALRDLAASELEWTAYVDKVYP